MRGGGGGAGGRCWPQHLNCVRNRAKRELDFANVLNGRRGSVSRESCVCFFFFFGRQRASVFLACLQIGFDLVMWPRLSFNSWSFYLSIPNDGIILVHHHAHPEWAFLKTLICRKQKVHWTQMRNFCIVGRNGAQSNTKVY